MRVNICNLAHSRMRNEQIIKQDICHDDNKTRGKIVKYLLRRVRNWWMSIELFNSLVSRHIFYYSDFSFKNTSQNYIIILCVIVTIAHFVFTTKYYLHSTYMRNFFLAWNWLLLNVIYIKIRLNYWYANCYRHLNSNVISLDGTFLLGINFNEFWDFNKFKDLMTLLRIDGIVNTVKKPLKTLLN